MNIQENPYTKMYIYPLLINGERYLLNKDPFIYAEEGAYKWWPEKVENLANELAFQNLYELGREIPFDRLKYEAARVLAPLFLSDDEFLKYYILDGGDYMKEYSEYNDQNNIWLNQIGMIPYNKELESPVNTNELEDEIIR